MLLHPTSLPGHWERGDLGPEAYRFVEFLAAAGQSVWQALPLGPPHSDLSPYQCLSVHAGNPALISPELLVAEGWLTPDELRQFADGPKSGFREQLIGCAYREFLTGASEQDKTQYETFKQRHGHWLEDFALYRALRRRHDGAPWNQWPVPLRDRQAQALDQVRREDSRYIGQVCFEQYVFFLQWSDLKSYANARDILLFGDLPIFVAYDSADVWAQRHFFKLNGEGRPEVIAGVPPDYFSSTGQRWGNPHYHWERLQAEGFRWWIERISSQLELFDIIRIDHFRGFEACWEIPVDEPTAINGRWVKVPGEALFKALQERFGVLPLVAEDLGVITAEVTRLREHYGLPGMKILQFAFDSDARNPYLPHHHESNSVVYTGTHDNDTTVGWYGKLTPSQAHYVDDYLGMSGEAMPWPLIRSALASVARLAIIPMQDILMLGSEHRMNTPGTEQGNWTWRFSWDQVSDELPRKLARLTALYGR